MHLNLNSINFNEDDMIPETSNRGAPMIENSLATNNDL